MWYLLVLFCTAVYTGCLYPTPTCLSLSRSQAGAGTWRLTLFLPTWLGLFNCSGRSTVNIPERELELLHPPSSLNRRFNSPNTQFQVLMSCAQVQWNAFLASSKPNNAVISNIALKITVSYPSLRYPLLRRILSCPVDLANLIPCFPLSSQSSVQ